MQDEAQKKGIHLAGQVQALERKMDRSLQEGHYKEAKAICEEILGLDPENVDAAYGMAAACARLNEEEACIGWLRKAIALGFANPIALRSSHHFDTIRDARAFRKVVGEVEAKLAEERRREGERFREEVREVLAREPSGAVDPEIPWLRDGRLEKGPVGGPAVLCLMEVYHEGCLKELPHLLEVDGKRKSGGMRIAVLFHERRVTPGRLEGIGRFAERYGILAPVGVVGPEWASAIPGPRVFPTHLVVDAAGRIRYHDTRVLTATELEVLLGEASGGQ